jgi:chromosome transmission fidelity protein 1
MARAARLFQFPFTPYPVQQELMEQIYDACTDGGVAVFESPTGTGKSLSVSGYPLR